MDADRSGQDVVSLPLPESIHRIECSVPWEPKHVAAYLIEGDEPMVVDVGAPDEENTSAFTAGLEQAGYTPEDIDHVLVTHPHTDHVGQVPLLRDAGATVYASGPALEQLRRDEADLIEGVTEVGTSVGLTGQVLEEAIDRTVDSLRRNRDLLDPDETVPIERSGTVNVGTRVFEATHTPGHQRNHSCFQTTIEETPVLFSGDALIETFRAGSFHVGLDHGAYDAVDAFYDALERLDAVDAQWVFPGHGPIFERPDSVVADTRARLDYLLEKVTAALAAIEPASPLAVNLERVDDLRSNATLFDTVGALGTLERRGQVTYEVEDGIRLYRTV